MNNKRLNEYLDRKGAEILDEDFLKEYEKTMIERTIPEIERKRKENARRVAEMRFSPWSRRKEIRESKQS